jgi:hypothetical protein
VWMVTPPERIKMPCRLSIQWSNEWPRGNESQDGMDTQGSESQKKDERVALIRTAEQRLLGLIECFVPDPMSRSWRLERQVLGMLSCSLQETFRKKNEPRR